jgi:hypothetical protein
MAKTFEAYGNRVLSYLGDGVAIAKHAGASGRGLDVVG